MVDFDMRASDILESMSGSEDIVRLDMNIAEHRAVFFYIDGMIDKVAVEFSIMAPLKALDHLDTPF